jgi:hypothetical protein
MPTFMDKQITFGKLASERNRLNREVIPPNRISNIFVPWAGPRLLTEGRGIYVVGIALNAESADCNQDFDARLKSTEGNFSPSSKVCSTPFWSFVNGLTKQIFNQSYQEASDRLGWSNLLKLGWDEGSPSKWPQALIKGQASVCIDALKEEFAHLRESLIFVASGGHHGVLYPATAGLEFWDTSYEQKKDGCLWWRQDAMSGNLFVWGYHPENMRYEGVSDLALDTTVKLSAKYLKPF